MKIKNDFYGKLLKIQICSIAVQEPKPKIKPRRQYARLVRETLAKPTLC